MEKNFYTFKRGNIILVDFSPQVGSEIKGKHFAIVLTKKDRKSNELLTVIPLTSKYHKNHIDLGDYMEKGIFQKIVEHQKKIAETIDIFLDDDIEAVTLFMEKTSTEIDMLAKVIIRYFSLKKHTYAKPQQITTISKLRIVKPVNRFDPIRSLVVPNEVMNIIDKAILTLFTRID